jgi:hypothetical protein
MLRPRTPLCRLLGIADRSPASVRILENPVGRMKECVRRPLASTKIVRMAALHIHIRIFLMQVSQTLLMRNAIRVWPFR